MGRRIKLWLKRALLTVALAAAVFWAGDWLVLRMKRSRWIATRMGRSKSTTVTRST